MSKQNYNHMITCLLITTTTIIIVEIIVSAFILKMDEAFITHYNNYMRHYLR